MVELAAYLTLVLLWGAHQLKRSLLIRWRFLFFGLIVILWILIEGYLLYQQYLAWRLNPLTQYFLPPHQGYGYLFYYGYSRFFGQYLISLAVASLVWLVIYLLNLFSRGRFFYPEEGFLSGASVFLVGHPAWMIYLPLLFIFQLIHTLVIFRFKPSSRVSLRALWVPTAIFVILISELLSRFYWWHLLKI